MKPALTSALVTLATLLLAGSAVGKTPAPVQGTWVGTQTGVRTGPVTVILEGERVVVSDGEATMVGHTSWRLHGPGTKDGRVTLQVDVTVSALVGANGRAQRTQGAKRVGSAAAGAEELRLCWAESSDTKRRPRWSERRPEASKGTRCFDVKRVTPAPTGTRTRTTTVVGPPDGSAPNPPPSLAPREGRACMAECQQSLAKSALSASKIAEVCGERCGPKPLTTSTGPLARCMSGCQDRLRGTALSAKTIDERCKATCSPVPAPEPAADFECMRECRHNNQMRAVSAEQIDADCRRTCTVK